MIIFFLKKLSFFSEDMKASEPRSVKGNQCLICRPLFKDADRLTFGLGFVGISFEVIVLHCVEVCFYIQ